MPEFSQHSTLYLVLVQLIFWQNQQQTV